MLLGFRERCVRCKDIWILFNFCIQFFYFSWDMSFGTRSDAFIKENDDF